MRPSARAIVDGFPLYLCALCRCQIRICSRWDSGTDYRIVNVRLLSGGTLAFETNKAPADIAVEDLTLHVGENAFPFKNGRVLRNSRHLGVW